MLIDFDNAVHGEFPVMLAIIGHVLARGPGGPGCARQAGQR
jgi:hypothetical protein